MGSPTEGQRLGPYTLGPRIGRGGMGVVHRARADDGREVAIKRLQVGEEGGSGVNVQRFLDEARLGADLEHPNIVRTFESGVDTGQAWLAMELLNGAPLSMMFRVPCEGLELGLVLGLVTQVLDALEYLHAEKGVIHRDLKPSNVFVTQEGRVKLIDFGIAVTQSLDATATATGMVRGSFPFVSPEYLRGESLDARADLFSLGLVLHELLTGSRVFAQENQAAVVSAILFGAIAPVRASRPELPAALDVEMQKLLSRDRTGRHGSARELKQALLKAAGMRPAPPEDLAAWLLSLRSAGRIEENIRAATRSLVVPGSGSADVPQVEAELVPPAPGGKRRLPTGVWVGALVAASLGVGWQLSRWTAVEPSALSPPSAGQAPAATPGDNKAAVEPPTTAEPPTTGEPPTEKGSTEPLPKSESKPVAKPTSGAKPKRAVGYLTVDAQPTYAQVSVDGKAIGPTPVYKHPLAVGSHRVEAVTGDGRKKTKSVSVQKEAEARLLFEW